MATVASFKWWIQFKNTHFTDLILYWLEALLISIKYANTLLRSGSRESITRLDRCGSETSHQHYQSFVVIRLSLCCTEWLKGQAQVHATSLVCWCWCPGSVCWSPWSPEQSPLGVLLQTLQTSSLLVWSEVLSYVLGSKRVAKLVKHFTIYLLDLN